MSPDILKEIDFLICSIVLGIGITFVYDWFRIFRRLIQHNNFFVSFEDFLFWLFATISAFYMLYTQNNGVLRWFAVCGAAIGMFLYKLLVSRYIVKIMVFILGKIGNVIKRIVVFGLKPFSYSAKKVSAINKRSSEKIRRITRFIKKKLTQGVKVVKLVLCKR